MALSEVVVRMGDRRHSRLLPDSVVVVLVSEVMVLLPAVVALALAELAVLRVARCVSESQLCELRSLRRICHRAHDHWDRNTP